MPIRVIGIGGPALLLIALALGAMTAGSPAMPIVSTPPSPEGQGSDAASSWVAAEFLERFRLEGRPHFAYVITSTPEGDQWSELSPEQMHVVLANSAAPPLGEDETLPRHPVRIGLGSDRLPIPWPHCAFSLTRVFVIGGTLFNPPQLIMSVERLGPSGLLGSGWVCDVPATSYAEVAINATLAHSTCPTCAVSLNQVGVLPPGGPLVDDEFNYAVIRGEGRLVRTLSCFLSQCFASVRFEGNGAVAQLTDSPPPTLPKV